MEIKKVIESAQTIQTENPFDEGHDFDHHQSVVHNCAQIIEKERVKLNSEVLTVAAWLHDYERNDQEKNNKVAREIISANGGSEEFILKVLDTINNHSFGGNQKSTEAKVLYDADKLEYVSIARFKAVATAVNEGAMSQETRDKYAKAWNERIPQVASTLHFNSSREIFTTRLAELKDYLASEPVWAGINTPML